jgi:hypothetical protein
MYKLQTAALRLSPWAGLLCAFSALDLKLSLMRQTEGAKRLQLRNPKQKNAGFTEFVKPAAAIIAM